MRTRAIYLWVGLYFVLVLGWGAFLSLDLWCTGRRLGACDRACCSGVRRSSGPGMRGRTSVSFCMGSMLNGSGLCIHTCTGYVVGTKWTVYSRTCTWFRRF
jgi:hypothetical protein